MNKTEKTNAIRILDRHGASYESRFYGDSGAVSGMEVAAVLGEEPAQVFKTLVTESASHRYYVFVVPVNKELCLKKAAKCDGEKSISMLSAKELLPLTGYVHGGCSPVGMKKNFPTVIDQSAASLPVIMCSGGKIGCQIVLTLDELHKAVPFTLGDITEN